MHTPHLQAQWRRGLAITLSTIVVAVLLSLLGLYALRCWRAGRLLGLSSLHAAEDVVTCPASKPALQHSDSTSSSKLGSTQSGALAIDMEGGGGAVPSGSSATPANRAPVPRPTASAGSKTASLAAPRSALLAQLHSPFEAQASVEFAAAAAWAAACAAGGNKSAGLIPAARRAASGGSGSGLRCSSKFDSALDALECGGMQASPRSPGKPIQLKNVGSLGEQSRLI